MFTADGGSVDSLLTAVLTACQRLSALLAETVSAVSGLLVRPDPRGVVLRNANLDDLNMK